MSRFEFDQLRTFVAAVETGTIKSSAERIGRSTSAASEQIRKLEEAFSSPLLIRGKIGVRPTPAGERMLGHARRLLAMHDAALDDMKGVALDGDIHIAMTDYFRPHTITSLLKRLKSQYPRLRLRISICKSALIEEDAGKAYDLGLSMRLVTPGIPSTHEGSVLSREKLAWVAAKDFQHEEIDILPILALLDSCAMHRLAVKFLEDSHIKFYMSHITSGVGGLQSAVLAGLGIACLNTSAIPEGAWAYVGSKKLPSLPDVEFILSPPRIGESSIVADVRKILTLGLKIL